MPPFELNPDELYLLQRCGDVESTRLRTLASVLSAVILSLLVIFAMWRGVPPQWLGWVFVGYVVLTAWEKVTYGMAVLRYKRLINKLVDHLEEIERSEQPGSA